MLARHLFDNKRHLSVRKIFLFCFPLFFILLSDSVMSYMFPILVSQTAQSNLLLGVIMALSSVLGIMCDFTFPTFLRNRSWRFQLTVGIIIAMLFPIFSNLGAVFSFVFFFVIATLIWGLYFEFLQFSQQSFVIGEENSGEYSKDWGIIYVIYDITINLGPIIGSFLLTQHIIASNVTVNIFQIISFIFCLIIMMNMPKHQGHKAESHIAKTIHVIKELHVWEKIGEKVWPAILVGVTVSFVNASFWTVGGLLGLEMAGDSGYDWIVMILFGVPLIFGSLILTKLTVEKRKKHFSHLSLLIGGLFLTSIFFFKGQHIIVLSIIALSSFAMSFAGPLNEAVYSDLLKRSGKGKLHLLGIAKANASLAYIIAPLFVGFLSDRVDYYLTLSIVGGVAVCMGTVLLIFSPRKIKLPLEALTQS